MGDSGARDTARRAGESARKAGKSARQAGKSFFTVSQSAARASASAASSATRTMHRMTNASGAGRTGLAQLIELTAASSVGDGFVAVALAGTLFISASVPQARGRVALALLITMVPFALLAPFVGPVLDRVRQGRRYVMLGTVLARGLLCWGMAGAVQHGDTVTLLPAAFGVLLLQKAYGVTRAAVTPRLLPREITLVTANARCALAALIASTAGVPLAAGIDALTGGGRSGAAWVLRIGTVVYFAAVVPGLRLPSGVDEPASAPDRAGGPAGATASGLGSARPARPASGAVRPGSEAVRPGPAGRPDGTRSVAAAGPAQSAGRRRRKLFPRPVGPVVAEAMGVNAALRAYSGFMIFFLAILLRSAHFGTVNQKLALAYLFGAAAIGGFAGTAAGAALRARSPQIIELGMLGATTLVTAVCAAYFSLTAALIVAFAAACGQTLVKLALDSIVQRDIPEDVRSSTFAASETLHQLSWVVGGLLGLLVSLTKSGVAGLTVATIGLAATLAAVLIIRRRRILDTRRRADRQVGTASAAR